MVYKGVSFVYRTSGDKWRGIRRFAVANDLEVRYIDAMIARIKKAGDVNLSGIDDVEDSYTIVIKDMQSYYDSIYSDDDHPCPHCAKYRCRDCPMWDGERSCCDEWSDVKEDVMRIKRLCKSEVADVQ